MEHRLWEEGEGPPGRGWVRWKVKETSLVYGLPLGHRPVEEMDRLRVSVSAAPTMCRVITFNP